MMLPPKINPKDCEEMVKFWHKGEVVPSVKMANSQFDEMVIQCAGIYLIGAFLARPVAMLEIERLAPGVSLSSGLTKLADVSLEPRNWAEKGSGIFSITADQKAAARNLGFMFAKYGVECLERVQANRQIFVKKMDPSTFLPDKLNGMAQ